jgi:hypothetical protein
LSSNSKKISIIQLLSILPNEELNKIAVKTNVNYYVKVLDGKSIFYLILYALVECQRNSLRTMEDIFNSPQFKFLFNLNTDKTVKYNSISERLSVINVDFFRQAYDLTYKYFSTYFDEQEQEKLKLIRVDSTMVAEAANKLVNGMNVGKKKDGKKQIKFTMAYDGNLPCLAEIFTTKEYLSEDLTIPKVVYKYANKDNKAIFVFDRGVQKRDVFCKLSKQDTGFVTRLKERSRYKVINEIEDGKNRPIGKLELISDQKIQLLKPGTKKLLKEPFRLIIAINPNTKVTYYFLTNLFEISVEEILSHYKKRWDIEVFFRFIKQELNFSHITSTSENGIAVMMYMTLITAMMVLVYKKLNEVGYKTAVRRISLELNEMIIKMIVVHCGGDPSLVFR